MLNAESTIPAILGAKCTGDVYWMYLQHALIDTPGIMHFVACSSVLLAVNS